MKSINKIITLKISAVLITFIMCYLVISNYYDLIENKEFISKISYLGFSTIIIVFPYLIITLSDTFGWLICFSKKMLHRSTGKLFAIRVATEALHTSLPGGAAYAELVRPYLLKKHLQLEYSESISANIITKINILVAQVIFLICGLLIFILIFSDTMNSTQFLSNPLFYPVSIIFISVIFLFTYLLYRKNLLLWVIHILGKIDISILRNILAKIRKPVLEINNSICIFSQNHRVKLILTIAFFLFTWMLLSFESLVILKVIGIEASISQMILIESLISIIRIFFFFIPGALGPQDAGLIILFNLVGFPDPISNAILFVFLKRFKELVWIIIGYIMLLLLGIRPGKLFKSNSMNIVASKKVIT